eukprot:jgi/Ulvmu1/7242/UM035_0029.1
MCSSVSIRIRSSGASSGLCKSMMSLSQLFSSSKVAVPIFIWIAIMALNNDDDVGWLVVAECGSSCASRALRFLEAARMMTSEPAGYAAHTRPDWVILQAQTPPRICSTPQASLPWTGHCL